MSILRTDFMTGGDGARLRFAVSTLPTAPRATVVILPGRSEFIEKYSELATDFAQRGLRSVVLDWRGQGLSARALADTQRGHIDDFAHYLDDLRRLLDHIAHEITGPCYLFGHSMGGHLALRHLHGRSMGFAGLMATAPMLRINLPLLKERAVRALAASSVRFGFAHAYPPGYGDYDFQSKCLNAKLAATDPMRFNRVLRYIEAEPMLAMGGPTLGWVHAAYRSMDLLRATTAGGAPDLPCLLLTAEADQVVCNRAIHDVAAKLPRSRVLALPGASHDLHFEGERTRRVLLSAIDRFLAGQLLPTPADNDAEPLVPASLAQAATPLAA